MPSHELENTEIEISRPPSPQEEEMPSAALEDPKATITEIPQQGKQVASVNDEIRASTDVEDMSDAHNGPHIR
jgi:hypothetical protein